MHNLLLTIDPTAIDWVEGAICPYRHLPLAVCAPNTGIGPYYGHHGNLLL